MRKMILGSAETELRPRRNFNLLPLEDPPAGTVQQKQNKEDAIFTKVKDETWDIPVDNVITHDGENVCGNGVKRGGGFEDGLEDVNLKENTEGIYLMSLGTAEYELQILEQQAQENDLSDVTCKFPEVTK